MPRSCRCPLRTAHWTPRSVAVVVRGLVRAGTALAVAATAHQVLNLRALRVPPTDPPPVAEAVSVLLPVRDEAHRVAPACAALLAQRGVPDLEVLVLDDGSTDGTADVVCQVVAGDPRVCGCSAGPRLDPACSGKPHACSQLAAAARGRVLVFVDADVVLAPARRRRGGGRAPRAVV